MMGLPLLLIVTAYFIYRRFYKINAAFYEKMVEDIAERETPADEAAQQKAQETEAEAGALDGVTGAV